MPSASEVPFGFNSDVLSPDHRARVSEIIRTLQAEPRLSVRLRGHTDDFGSPEFNRLLGLRRAQAVARALRAAGIAVSRVQVESAGATEPLPGPAAADARARSRRVEILYRVTDGL